MSDLISQIEKSYVRKNVPDVRTGDRVRVHQKVREGKKERIQIFEGVVLKVAGGRGINGSFTVRRIASGVGVEKSFPFHLPTLVKVEKIKSAKVRQARIYYIREMKGRAANRMKNEKEAKGIWEDIIAEEKPLEEEVSQAEVDAQRAAKNAEEKSAETEETSNKIQDTNKSQTSQTSKNIKSGKTEKSSSEPVKEEKKVEKQPPQKEPAEKK